MLNPPGAGGRAASSAETPSQEPQPREQRRIPTNFPTSSSSSSSSRSPAPSRTLEQAGILLPSGGREGASRREEAPGCLVQTRRDKKRF